MAKPEMEACLQSLRRTQQETAGAQSDLDDVSRKLWLALGTAAGIAAKHSVAMKEDSLRDVVQKARRYHKSLQAQVESRTQALHAAKQPALKKKKLVGDAQQTKRLCVIERHHKELKAMIERHAKEMADMKEKHTKEETSLQAECDKANASAKSECDAVIAQLSPAAREDMWAAREHVDGGILEFRSTTTCAPSFLTPSKEGCCCEVHLQRNDATSNGLGARPHFRRVGFDCDDAEIATELSARRASGTCSAVSIATNLIAELARNPMSVDFVMKSVARTAAKVSVMIASTTR